MKYGAQEFMAYEVAGLFTVVARPSRFQEVLEQVKVWIRKQPVKPDKLKAKAFVLRPKVDGPRELVNMAMAIRKSMHLAKVKNYRARVSKKNMVIGILPIK